MERSEQMRLATRIANIADVFNMRIGQLIENARSEYLRDRPEISLFYLTDEELRDAINLYAMHNR